MIEKKVKTVFEYIWIGGKNEIRSKTRVIPNFLLPNIENIPEWNYDGSSTGQADSNGDTEVILKPCALFIDPLRSHIIDSNCYLILCDTYKPVGEPLETNHRHMASNIFQSLSEKKPWFGLEQEYFILFHERSSDEYSDGLHYCGITKNKLERSIVEQHLHMCLAACLKISGMNSEVSNGQWEFQIGPCEGIEAGDHLIIARYLLERIAEKFGASVEYHPKPFQDINGSGCHINFSTQDTRNKNGYEVISRYIETLECKHRELIEVYGEDNHFRLTGLHETSSIFNFSWGVGTRNTSIRIPNQTFQNNSGYFEDRRPAANIDPYLATSTLFKICCSDE